MPLTKSSMFTSYERKGDEIHLRFSSNGAMMAYPCNDDDFKAFESSESKGKFFHQVFKERKGRIIDGKDS